MQLSIRWISSHSLCISCFLHKSSEILGGLLCKIERKIFVPVERSDFATKSRPIADWNRLVTFVASWKWVWVIGKYKFSILDISKHLSYRAPKFDVMKAINSKLISQRVMTNEVIVTNKASFGGMRHFSFSLFLFFSLDANFLSPIIIGKYVCSFFLLVLLMIKKVRSLSHRTHISLHARKWLKLRFELKMPAILRVWTRCAQPLRQY